MNRASSLILAMAVVTISAPGVHAQTCLGLPAASVASRNLTLAASFPEGQSNFSARLGGIKASGAFAGVGAVYSSYDDVDDASAFGISADIGKELSLASDSPVRICPVADATYLFGPNFDFDGEEVKSNSLIATAGGAIGGVIAASPTFKLIPFASVGLAYFNVRVSFDGESESDSETGGLLGAGIGLSFNDRVIIRPTISKPFGFDGESDAVFGIGVSLPLGRR